MLQLHAQLTLIRALPCVAAMLLATFRRRIGTLLFCPLHGLGLRDRACSGAFSASALLTIRTLGVPFSLPVPHPGIPMARFPHPAEAYGSSKRTSYIIVREWNWSLENAAQSLSNRQQIDPQVHSRRVKVRSAHSAPLSLSGSTYEPIALTKPDFRAIIRG